MLLIPIVIVSLAQAGAAAVDQAEPPATVFAPAPPAPPPPPPPPTPYPRTPPKPKGDPSGWVRSSDYPKQLRNGQSGVTQFRLLISDTGKPIACDVMSSSGHPELDAKTCEVLMKRAKFVPARSGYNRPTNGSYTARARWVAPAPK
ncbi:TonB family protein [Novosphingobium sp.]|uniref:TonB family protein n=1 Tax=Novosphingobium sp. TaxID=1874826 RepID=UPI00386210D0